MVVAAAHAVGEGGIVHVASGFGVAGASGVGFVDVGSVGPAVVFILIPIPMWGRVRKWE